MLKGFVLPFNSIGSIYRTQKAILFECPHPALIKTKWEKKYLHRNIIYLNSYSSCQKNLETNQRIV